MLPVLIGGDTSAPFSPWSNTLHLNQSLASGASRPWPEGVALGHLYQQRAPSPWAFGRGEAFQSVEDVEPGAPAAAADPTIGAMASPAFVAAIGDNIGENAATPSLTTAFPKEGGSSDTEGCRKKAMEELAGTETPLSKEELYVRLCGIFEEEKVKYVMETHPDEIYPQKICSLILTYFPS